MIYLVFSLDEGGCQDVWECFEDRAAAERCLADSYDDYWMDFEKNFEEKGTWFSRHSPCAENADYGSLAWAEEDGDKEHRTEFFLVEIPESKILRRLCCTRMPRMAS